MARHRFSMEPMIERFLASVGDEADGWIEGYAGKPFGKQLAYESWRELSGGFLLQPKLRNGRAETSWESAPVAAEFRGESVTFIWTALMCWKPGPKPLHVLVDGRERFVVRSLEDLSWTVEGADGGRMHFDTIWVDGWEDRCGTMRLVAPSSWLTPGKPVRIAIVARMEDEPSWIHPYLYTDTAGWLRRELRDTVFGRATGGLRPGRPVRFHLVSRADWAGRSIALVRDGEVVGQSVLSRGEGVSVADVEVSAEALRGVDGALGVRVDGKDVGRVDAAGMIAGARLIARHDVVAKRVRAGSVLAEQMREAAMVLAWGDLLEGALTGGEQRIDAIMRRARSPEYAMERLTGALADFETAGDSYAGKREGFHTAYISQVDGSGQIYSLYVPPNYDPNRAYGLNLRLHGANGTFGEPEQPERPLDYLLAAVDGRGNSGYQGLGELDVLEVIADVGKHYTVDPDRITIAGGSMGGGGTWRMCARYPDVFAAAAADYGYPVGLPLANMGSVPMWTFHDDTDFIVPVDYTRVGVRQMQAWGYPVVYTESTGGGHTITKKLPAWDNRGWVHGHRRDPHPSQVCYTTVTPERGRAYWLEIRELTDPVWPGSVRAKVVGGVAQTHLIVQLENVDVLGIDLPAGLFDPNVPVSIVCNGGPQRVAAPLPGRVYLSRSAAGDVSPYGVTMKDPTPVRPYRAYSSGLVNRMYTSGEPLMIVKGTGWEDKVLVEAIGAFCEELRYASGGWGLVPMGGVPVKADVDVTPEDLARCNVIAVGSAKTNALLAKVTGSLAAREAAEGLALGGETYSLAGRGYVQVHYNPLAPQRLMLVLASDVAGAFDGSLREDVLAAHVTGDLPLGLWLFDVEPRRTVRCVAWDKAWRCRADVMVAQRVPSAFGQAGSRHKLEVDALSRATGADYVFDRTDAAESTTPLDIRHARWHDVAVECARPIDVFTYVVSGATLVAQRQQLARTNAKVAYCPAHGEDRIDSAAEYLVCTPQWRPSNYTRAFKQNPPHLRRVSFDRFEWVRREALKTVATSEAK